MSGKITIKTGNVELIKSEMKKAINNFKTDEFVTVGIHQDAGQHAKSELNNATIGAILHFGTDRIPARPWLDVGVATGNQQYINILNDALKRTKVNLSTPLKRMGVVAAAKVQLYMTNLMVPPNAPATIAQKGFDNPLIWTGELRQSVTFKLDRVKPTEGI